MEVQSYFHFPLDLMEAMERSGNYFLYPSVDLSSFYCVFSRQNVVNAMFMSNVVRCMSCSIPNFWTKVFVDSSIHLTLYNRVCFDQFLWEILWWSCV
jgi:hypothetical protein